MLSFAMTNLLKRQFTAKYRETVVNKFSLVAKKVRVPVAILRANIDGMEGEAFLQIDRNVMGLVIDAFLGGEAVKPDERQDVTEIEERLIFKMTERIIRYFEKANARSVNVALEVKEVVKKAENFEMSTLDDLITTVLIDINFGETSGSMLFGFPSFLIDPILKKGGKKPAAPDRKPAKALNDNMPEKYERLKNVEVECRVILSDLNIKLKDLIDIQVGDCISLEHDIFTPLSIRIGDSEKFLGVPGLRGKKLAVKITENSQGGK
jgi:flagellar motor switch protein FliM